MTQSFENLGLSPDVLATLAELDYTEPTPIQSQAIPVVLSGQDVVGQAQTGTGKTAAFTLPLIQQLEDDGLQILMLAPTRELATQVAQSVYQYGKSKKIKVLPIYGGQSYDRQIRRLKKGVHVVVGTPGRTLDLIRKGELDLSTVRFVVLDEGDEMLKMGFIDDIEAILSRTDKHTRQTLLFSATFPERIRKLAQNYMRDPQTITIETKELTVENIGQRYYMVQERDKVAALTRLLETEVFQNILVFCRTKKGSSELTEELLQRGYAATAIHGDLAQNERERVLKRFRTGDLNIMVATDVVARGMDIPEVSHVVNYDIPQLPIEYVHRIGRTGRAGRSGDAITLVTPKERHRLKQIERFTKKNIKKGKLPTPDQVLQTRNERFMTDVMTAIASNGETEDILLENLAETEFSAEQIVNGLLYMLRNERKERAIEEIRDVREQAGRNRNDRRNGRGSRNDRGRNRNYDKSSRRKNRGGKRSHEEGMVRLQLSVGRTIGIKPGEIVSNVAGQAKIPGKVIGAIEIHQNESFVDVPEEHAGKVLKSLKNSQIRGQSLNPRRAS